VGFIFPIAIKAAQYLLLSPRKEHKDMTGREQCCFPQPFINQTFWSWQEKAHAHVPDPAVLLIEGLCRRYGRSLQLI